MNTTILTFHVLASSFAVIISIVSILKNASADSQLKNALAITITTVASTLSGVGMILLGGGIIRSCILGLSVIGLASYSVVRVLKASEVSVEI